MTNKPLNDTIHRVTQRVIANSRDSRAAYLDLMDRESERQVDRQSEWTIDRARGRAIDRGGE